MRIEAIARSFWVKMCFKIPLGAVFITTIRWRQVSNSEIKRRTTTIKTRDGNQPFGLLEYWFEGEVRPVVPKKNNGKSFVSRCKSTLSSIRSQLEQLPKKGNKTIFIDNVRDVATTSIIHQPRNVQQVSHSS